MPKNYKVLREACEAIQIQPVPPVSEAPCVECQRLGIRVAELEMELIEWKQAHSEAMVKLLRSDYRRKPKVQLDKLGLDFMEIVENVVKAQLLKELVSGGAYGGHFAEDISQPINEVVRLAREKYFEALKLL